MRAFVSIMDLLHIPLSIDWSLQYILFIKPYVRGHISGFLTDSFSTGRVVNPTPNPQPGGPTPIFITPGTGWPSYTPRHWVLILVTFYDMDGQQWDFFNHGHHTGCAFLSKIDYLVFIFPSCDGEVGYECPFSRLAGLYRYTLTWFRLSRPVLMYES